MNHKYKLNTIVDINVGSFGYGKIKRINIGKTGFVWDYMVLIFWSGAFKELGFNHKEISIREDQLNDLF